MTPHHHNRAAKVLPVLLALWLLQGCAQVSTQSRPADTERPPKIEAPSPVSPEAPAVEKTPTSVTPEEVPPGEEPFPEPETSVSDGSEAPAKAAALLPLPREEEARVKPTPMAPEPTPCVHIVRWKGATLSLIAQWYTASWKNGEVLARANPGIDPDRITIGNRIRVPESLLKKRKPMPFEFIPPSPSRTRQKSTAGEPRADAEEVVLFGPTEATTRHEPAPEGNELFEPEEIAGKPAEIPEETGLFGPVE